MAIDQRDVSSTLRFMDDRALQRYAAMHKNDPYIFPLAFQESQNRQKLRMSQQRAQGMQPQPKVADQALAQMAPPPMPEEQGIGALPAPNMQMMADGGIAGYEGYDEGSSDFGQGPVVMMAEGGHVPRYQGNPRDGSVVRGDFFSQLDQQKAEQINQLNQQLAIIEPQLRAAAASGDQQAIQMYAQQAQAIRNQISTVREATGNRAGAIDKLTTPPQQATSVPETNRSAINQSEQAARKDPAVYGAPLQVVAAPKADPNRRTNPVTEAAPKDATTEKETAGLDALVKDFTRSTELAQGALRNQRVGLASQLEQEALGTKEEGEKRRKERGDVFAGKEARLAEREKGVAGLGDKYMGLALLQAGAAMMSTPGNIGAVLGKGIQVGSERYIAGIDKINAAKDKFAEARDRLDDLRINRDDLNEKEIKEENRAIRTARIQGQQLFVEGATKDLEISNANMGKIFSVAADDLKTDKTLKAERANVLTRESGANVRSAGQIAATLNAPERMAFTAALEKTKTKTNPQGDPAAAYQSIIAMKREPVSIEKLRGDWLDMGKRAQIQADYPNIKSLDDYVAVFGGGVGSSGGAGGDGFKIVGVR
jgi:hypothetical protein